MMVIVPSGEFFFTKTKTKKGRLGLTSTYKYKTIHTSVWMLPQGRSGRGERYSLQPSSPRLYHHGCNHEGSSPQAGRSIPQQAHRTVPLSQSISSQRPGGGGGHGMEAGQRWEISPPMGSIVSRNVGWKKGRGAGVKTGGKRRHLRTTRRAPQRDPL